MWMVSQLEIIQNCWTFKYPNKHTRGWSSMNMKDIRKIKRNNIDYSAVHCGWQDTL